MIDREIPKTIALSLIIVSILICPVATRHSHVFVYSCYNFMNLRSNNEVPINSSKLLPDGHEGFNETVAYLLDITERA